MLPAGTKLPDGLAVVADGRDVYPESEHEETHHTIYPTRDMTVQEFQNLRNSFQNAWKHKGKK